MTTLLDMVRQRRTQLETTGFEHLGPTTDAHRQRAIRQVIANAPHDPDAAELLRKCRAKSPELKAVIDREEAEMQAETKARS